MRVKTYLVSVPERIVRSVVALGAGAAREFGEVVVPTGIRRGQLYQNLVETTLRYLIEQVGGVEAVYRDEEKAIKHSLARRTAGNVVEDLGIVAFRASPVWVLAALADVCGMGRQLIPEIAEALQAQGLLDKDAHFDSVDQILDGLERTSSRLAATVNTPPLDVASLRAEWRAIREEARSLHPGELPSRETIRNLWTDLRSESARQGTSVFETSSMLAVSAVAKLPEGLRWLTTSTTLAASRTGQMAVAALLDHYRRTLGEIRQIGFARYAIRQFRPYVRAAVLQFSPRRRTLTERLVDTLAARFGRRSS